MGTASQPARRFKAAGRAKVNRACPGHQLLQLAKPPKFCGAAALPRRIPSRVAPRAHLQIAIDGPAASGKTTVARLTARRLRVLYLDTGAMYRALAWLALRTGTDVDNGAALARLMTIAPIEVELDETAALGFRVVAGGDELDEAALSGNEVTAIVSAVSAHPAVRAEMVRAQRAIAERGPVVMAGRDIGTVVLPNSAVKIYLTASVPARITRRRIQLEEAGVNVDAHRLAQEIEERDRLDQTRAVSPLAPAPDAHMIDSSEIGAEQVVDEICTLVAASFDRARREP